jgi:ribonuclease E
MLENEPDTNNTANAPESTPPPPVRRRRAASRPAGPPTSVGDAAPTDLAEVGVTTPAGVGQSEVPAPRSQTEAAAPVQPSERVAPTQQSEVWAPTQQSEAVTAPESGQSEVPAAALPAVKTAKKAPAKRVAKKAPATKKTAAPAVAPDPRAPDALGFDASALVASAPEQALPDAASTEPGDAPAAPRARTPRKRAATKVATVPAIALDASSAPADEPAEPTRSAAEPAIEVDPEEVEGEFADEVTVADEPAPDAHPETEAVVASDPTDEQLVVSAPVGRTTASGRRRSAIPNPFDVPDPFVVVAADPDLQPGISSSQTPDEDLSEEDTDAASDDDESGEGNRRRRRRRGGRRRRRGGSDDDSSEAEHESGDSGESGGGRAAEVAGSAKIAVGADAREDAPAESVPGESVLADDLTGEEDSTDSEADGEDSEGQRRRRRRRRRRGEETGSAADDPTEVVVRVREPRARKKAASQEVTGIDGSTRMEAKRQRRREGREAGRRRAPILSEAEFLARRESVSRKMIIRQRDDLSQIAVIEDGILVEHYVDRASATSLIGNVYLGRVQNVLPSMEAAFIDIGRGRNAVLYAGEVDWDSFGAEGQGRKVEKVLKSGQTILVQVSKDPVGAKGARLTNHVSIPGRYLVYAPGGHLSGISRKLPDTERKRLKDILADLVGELASVIVRTAAEGASEEELVRDVNRLKAQWEDIEKKVKAGNGPQLLYGEPDLTVRIVRDLFTEDFADLIIQGNGLANDAYDAVEGYVTHVAPHLQERLHRWDCEVSGDLFAEYRLDEQIAKGLERKVFLPSGGSLIIDRTEAMTVIDVNTGKFTGTGGNLEATVTSNNLEAAEEIVRQLRLRDIGGIIVIDFIDMVLPNNRELLLRRLVECLGRDRTRHQVAEVTSLGLIQMTRKKIGTGLLEAFSSECAHCHGRGYEVHDLPVDSQKQADGGAREPRPGDHRRGGNSNSNGAKSPDRSQQRASEPDQEPVKATTNDAESTGGGEERPSRSRRGGRGRRSATREQGAPTEATPEPVAAG